jgi:hypothetical protein
LAVEVHRAEIAFCQVVTALGREDKPLDGLLVAKTSTFAGRIHEAKISCRFDYSTPSRDQVPFSCSCEILRNATTIVIQATQIEGRFPSALARRDDLPPDCLVAVLCDALTFVVNLAKFELCGAVTLNGQFSVETTRDAEVPFIVSC